MSKRPDLLYGIDDNPPWPQAITLGFQHYLTMFGSTVAIPLLLASGDFFGMGDDPRAVGWLISTMFFISGITTLLQTTWGNRLPIVQGGTFSLLAPTAAICGMAMLDGAGWQVKIQHVQGAIIIGSVVEAAVGYSGLMGALLRFVGPITIAPTIALIGLALFKFGAPKAGLNWWIGGLTIAGIVVFSQYLRRKHRVFELFPILLAILLAWGVATLLTILGVFEGPVVNDAGEIVKAAHPGYVSTANLQTAPWFRIPYPFQWGWPKFSIAAIVGMLAGFVASMVESVGDYYACARLSGAPIPDKKVVNRGIGMEGVGSLIAGIFGTGNGTTSYSENIGAIGLTRVGSRRVVQVGAVMMIVLGAVGKFGALFTTIPDPIVGGMYCAMFGMIASVGLSNLQFVNLNSPRNLFIIGFALFMGLSVPEYFAANPITVPAMPNTAAWLHGTLEALANIANALGSTGMAVGAVIALVFDNTIPGTPEERGLTAWSSHEASDV